MKEKINLKDSTMYLIIALGESILIHPLIDEIYEKNNITYYEYYKKSPYFNFPIFSSYSIIKADKMQKVAGILSWAQEHKQFGDIDRLINKGYKFTWNYIKGKNRILIDEYYQSLYKKLGGIDNAVESQGLCHFMVLLFLVDRSNNSLDLVMNTQFGKITIGRLIDYVTSSFRKDLVFTDEYMESLKERIKPVRDDFIHVKSTSLDVILENIQSKEMDNYYSTLNSADRYFNARYESGKAGITKYLAGYGGLLKSLGLNEVDICTMCTMNKEDIDFIIAQYLNAVDYNGFTEQDRDCFLISAFLIKALVDEYSRTKNIYLKNLRDEFYSDMRLQKEKTQKVETDLRLKEEQLSSEKKLLSDKFKELSDENTRLKKENEKLLKRIKESEANKKEFLSLREFLYSLESSEDEVPDSEADMQKEMLEYLSNKKCVVIGGHQRWQNRMKELLPSFTFVNLESKSMNFQFLDSSDGVFFNTATNSHSMYLRIMERMSKNNTPLYYLNGNNNWELSVKEIYSALTK